MKIVRVILSPEADEVLQHLEQFAKKRKQEKTLVNGFLQKSGSVKYNIHYGDAVAKDKISLEYQIKYNADNLFRVEIPGFWRFTYTLKKQFY